MAEITQPRFPASAPRDESQIPNQSEIQKIMKEAHRKIEERKNQSVSSASVNPAPVAGPSIDTKLRLAQLKARIQAKTASLGLTPAADEVQAVGRPAPLILDAEGRTVDNTGKAVQLVQRMPTLKANIRAQRKEHVVKVVREKPVHDEEEATSKFLDARVPVRCFHFHCFTVSDLYFCKQ